ncbi:HYR domain-containing protein [Myxococcus sp. K38C18041901]|uniref:kelch repeat-containing protein n=1 Tax=Myxococcus guangdongensis TaxID=2906760 RepID=UPI0020A70977|nr:kelch repeat-containing protein [Myxococcus guangdongensis]MCP3065090.1 HYR domain-containing protein [Myxococcus guangdongensis]
MQRLVLMLCCAMVWSCEPQRELPAAEDALALARSYFPELATDEGAPRRFSSSDTPASGADARVLTARLTGSGALEISTRGLSFRVESSPGDADHGMPRHEGAVSYVGERHFFFPVGGFAELSQGWRGSRIEEAWVVDASEPTHRAEYRVTLPGTVTRLRDTGEVIEFLDEDGSPVLRFHPSEVRDAQGTSRRGTARLSGVRESAVAKVFDVVSPQVGIVSEVALAGLSAPLVVDPGWSSTAAMATARGQHAAIPLTEGSVLVVGGVNSGGFVTSAERFDPTRGAWSVVAAPGITGNTTFGVMLPTGSAVAFTDGSLTGRLYDAAANTWTATGAMSASRALPTATLLSSGQVLVAGGSSLATAELYDPTTNTFTPTGSMSAARRAHVAARLRDGRVLVVSGFNNAAVEVPSAELYDPTAGTWSLAAPPLVPRHYATGTLLPDGRVLLAGGRTASGVIAQSEIYDPTANTWTATGALRLARNGHTATLLPDGKVVVMGGSDDARVGQTVSEMYDPATGTWSDAGTVTVGRENATATLLVTGQVLVAGGFNQSGGPTVFSAEADRYEASSSRWTPAGALATGRESQSAALLPSGQVLVAGGRDDTGVLSGTERYTPASDSWAPAAAMATTRERATLTLLRSGQVLAVGGSNNGGARLSSAERYDPTTNTWAPAGNMAGARDGHTATLLATGDVLVTGGRLAGVTEIYDVSANTWRPAATTPETRSNHAAVLLPDGRVLVAGGRFAATSVNTVELYDPTADTWTPVPPLAEGRAHFSLVLLPSGRVLAAGGQSPTGETATAELYDPTTNTWSPAGTLTTARAYHATALLPSGRVLVSGGEGGGSVLDSAELYDPVTNTWQPAANLPEGRSFSKLIVLSTGEALTFGGQDAGGLWLASASRYNDTGAQPAWRPTVATPDQVPLGCPVRITGTGFQGISHASSGDYRDSSAAFPQARLQAIEGRRLWSLPGSDMSATGVTATIPASATPGAYVLSVFANGVGSGRVVQAVPNTAPTVQGLSALSSNGVPAEVTLTGTDAEGSPLTFIIVTPPAHGTLSGTPPNLTYTPNPGYIGPDSFTYRARDCGLDSNVATVTVDVSDDPPTITCPADLVVDATSASGAVVDYPPATASDNGGPAPTVTYSPPSGSTLPLGDTTVTATAVDTGGQQVTCTFQVTVRDTTAPTLTCPANIEVQSDAQGGAEVTYSVPPPTDTSGPVTVTTSHPSGSRFPSGRTRVTVTATDASGNSSRCEFDVTVQTFVVRIAGGSCQAAGGGANLALVVLAVLAVWAGRRRGREEAGR